MKRPFRSIALTQAGLVLMLGLMSGACSARKGDAAAGTAGMGTPTIPAGADYAAADVAFMQGMIGHHAQALTMAAWAPTHGASEKVLLLCKKITISQTDEIKLMQEWLQYHHQPAPSATDPHPMMMPGMLSPEQMKALDAARGPVFDSLFLTDMIQHHQGAIDMVTTLFNTPGAGLESTIADYANGVNSDQRGEISLMQGMLDNAQGGSAQ